MFDTSMYSRQDLSGHGYMKGTYIKLNTATWRFLVFYLIKFPLFLT